MNLVVSLLAAVFVVWALMNDFSLDSSKKSESSSESGKGAGILLMLFALPLLFLILIGGVAVLMVIGIAVTAGAIIVVLWKAVMRWRKEREISGELRQLLEEQPVEKNRISKKVKIFLPRTGSASPKSNADTGSSYALQETEKSNIQHKAAIKQERQEKLYAKHQKMISRDYERRTGKAKSIFSYEFFGRSNDYSNDLSPVMEEKAQNDTFEEPQKEIKESKDVKEREERKEYAQAENTGSPEQVYRSQDPSIPSLDQKEVRMPRQWNSLRRFSKKLKEWRQVLNGKPRTPQDGEWLVTTGTGIEKGRATFITNVLKKFAKKKMNAEEIQKITAPDKPDRMGRILYQGNPAIIQKLRFIALHTRKRVDHHHPKEGVKR